MTVMIGEDPALPDDCAEGVVDAPPPIAWASDALRDVAAERRRQIEAEGWTPEHDDEHESGVLASAAVCYASNAATWLRSGMGVSPPERYADFSPISWQRWPWAEEWWKPKNERSDLVRAAALILAEIERLDRSVTPNG